MKSNNIWSDSMDQIPAQSRLMPHCLVFFALLVLLTVIPRASASDNFRIISETTEAGIVETRFDVEVNGQTIPGILWAPQGAQGTRPLMLFGHGGSQHKRVSNILRMARDLVSNEHYAVVAIDGPGHGDRASDRAAGDRSAREAMGRANTTAEWQAVIDVVQELDHVGEGPIGYWGVSMGTRFGVPLIAAEPRIKVAILGLFGLSESSTGDFADAVRAIEVPLIFVYQREDSLMTLEQGVYMFDSFGSADKSMHINPGGHTAVPVSEREKWKPFLVNHLGKARLQQ